MIIMNNINEDFIKNAKNIRFYNNYLYLSCFYRDKNALIKITSNDISPIISLMEKQKIEDSESNYFFPIIYNIGKIDFNLLLNKNLINFQPSEFKDIINNILNHNIDTIISDEFINFANNSKNYNKELNLCKLLLNFNQQVNIIIFENIFIYNESNLFNNFNIINNDLFQIFYIFIYSINLMNNLLNISCNFKDNIILIPYNNDETLDLSNKYKINKKYRIIINILDFNNNIKYDNSFNLINHFIFNISKFNNFFKDNSKIIKSFNKILFKKNDEFRYLIFTKQLYLANNISDDTKLNNCTFNLKYLIKKLVKNKILFINDKK